MQGDALRLMRRRMQMVFQDPYSVAEPAPPVGEPHRRRADADARHCGAGGRQMRACRELLQNRWPGLPTRARTLSA